MIFLVALFTINMPSFALWNIVRNFSSDSRNVFSVCFRSVISMHGPEHPGGFARRVVLYAGARIDGPFGTVGPDDPHVDVVAFVFRRAIPGWNFLRIRDLRDGLKRRMSEGKGPYFREGRRCGSSHRTRISIPTGAAIPSIRCERPPGPLSAWRAAGSAHRSGPFLIYPRRSLGAAPHHGNFVAVYIIFKKRMFDNA